MTGGFTGVFGFTAPNGLLFETRYGSAGGPNLKFGAGVHLFKR